MIHLLKLPLKKSIFIIFLVLLIDQCVKFWVKTNMYLGEEHHILGNWFIIHFTENEGMAFGMMLPGIYGKLLLTTFRLVVAAGGSWYLFKLIREGAHTGLVISGSLILAGALGNIIDSTFYGKLFSESDHQLALLLPEQGGYAGLLYGRVVDMLYFPILQGHFPSWFPFWANEDFIFFRPIFNIADSSITIGVAIIILFQKKFFPEKAKSEIQEPQEDSTK